MRTASELAVLLPLPILMIVEGYARPLFPGSTPASASPFVVIVQSRPKETYPPTGPATYIHWTQWQSVVVPILNSIQTYRWRGFVGELGDLLTLQNTIVGPNGDIIFPIGFEIGFSGFNTESVGALYSCDQHDLDRVNGRVAEYLEEMSGSIFRDAVAAGY